MVKVSFLKEQIYILHFMISMLLIVYLLRFIIQFKLVVCVSLHDSNVSLPFVVSNVNGAGMWWSFNEWNAPLNAM